MEATREMRKAKAKASHRFDPRLRDGGDLAMGITWVILWWFRSTPP